MKKVRLIGIGAVSGVILMDRFPLNYMSTIYHTFGLCQAVAGFAARRMLKREEAHE